MTDEEIQKYVDGRIAAASAELEHGMAAVAQREFAFAAPTLTASAQATSTSTPGDGFQFDTAPVSVGAVGKNPYEAFTWKHIGGGTISVSNIFFAFEGVVQTEYTAAEVAIGTSDTYVYAIVTWLLADDGPPAIEEVTIEVTESWEEASKDDTELGELHIPIGLFKSSSGAWGSTVVCLKRFLSGVVMLASPSDSGYPKPWDISFAPGESTTTATLSNCCYMRGPVYRDVGELTCVLTGTEDITICAHIDHDTGDATLQDTFDEEIPADADNMLKIPLYIVRSVAGVWSVKLDLRGMTQAVLYV